MSFLWPQLLWLLLALPLLVGLYVWLLGRRRKSAVRFANLALVKDAMGGGQRVRRHLPPALFLISLALMILAIARPTTVLTLPTQHDLVVLAMDVSRSMLAEDVQPNRIVAAQAAARAFIAEQPMQTRIAIVAFAGSASVVQAPTNCWPRSTASNCSARPRSATRSSSRWRRSFPRRGSISTPSTTRAAAAASRCRRPTPRPTGRHSSRCRPARIRRR